MPKAAPSLVTFDAGELSPLLAGRIDLAKYANGCSRLENFLPLIQGPAQRRGGTRFVSPVKNSATRCWLVKFQVSQTISYMIEIGDQYFRFYASRGQLIAGGVPVEVSTPYTAAVLTNENGTCRLHFMQSNDTMYIFHPEISPRKLLRLSATSFSLEIVDFQNGPFGDANIDPSINIVASGTSGTVDLTATAPVFQPLHFNTRLRLESADLSGVKPWAVNQHVDVGDFRRVDFRVYKCTNVPPGGASNIVTGTVTPTHTSGRAWDGDGSDFPDDIYGPIGVEWEYQHSSYGIVRITNVISSTHVTADVQGVLPADLVTAGTTKFSWPTFSAMDGYPEFGAFWRKRLWLLGGRKLAGSVSNDFENFAQKDPDVVTPDSAIVETLDSEQINSVSWLVPSENLLLGTNGDEWIVGPIQDSQAVSATNIRADSKTANGSRPIQPVKVGERILFVQASGRKVRDYIYDFSTNSYPSTDTTKLNPGITKSGIVDLTYQQEPDSTVWAARADGTLVGITYDREQERSDVYGWHRHPMVNGIVEAVETMPSPDGASQDLWLIVRRQVNGQAVRYVEWLNPPLDDDQPQAEAFYVDCGLTYRGAPATLISGLGHLEGQIVDILVDGATHPQRTVTGGAITLQVAGSVVHVGLPAPCRLDTMDIEAGAANGTAQGKTKRISNVVLRFLRSLGGKVGPPDSTTPADLNFRRPSDPMDAPPPLFTGDIPAEPWPDGYEGRAIVSYTNDQPLPVTLLAILPIVDTQDDR